MAIGPLFQLVYQHGKADCGVAALATLLQEPYEDVLISAGQFNPRVLKNGLYGNDLIRIAMEFGVTLHRRTRHIDLDDHIGILGLKFPKGAEHWVYLSNGLIFDPDEKGKIWDAYEFVKSFRGKVTELLEESV